MKRYLILLGALFGPYAVAQTVTAPVTLAATQMSIRTTGTVMGSTLGLFVNGSVAQNISFPAATYKFQIEAYGSPAGGVYPNMRVSIDDKAVANITVNSRFAKKFEVTGLKIAAGIHKVSLALTNDAYFGRGQDRNLFLNKIAILQSGVVVTPNPPPTLTTEIPASQMSYKSVGEQEGNVWNLFANGYLENAVSFPASGAVQAQVQAFGSQCDGVYPNMQLRIDQKAVANVTVGSPLMATYTMNFNAAAGNHKIEIAFTNDKAVGGNCDRNLYLAKLIVKGGDLGTPGTPGTPEPPPPAPDALQEIINQNTAALNTVFPYGVPHSYSWYDGKDGIVGPYVPPAGFTAMTGWGQVYPQEGKANVPCNIFMRDFKAYVHLKSGGWRKVQDQSDNPVAGAHFVGDFGANAAIGMSVVPLADGSTRMDSPPNGYNNHYWLQVRGVYTAGTIDGVYVEYAMRTDNANANFVAQAGADYWRDAAAEYVDGFDNNPGIGENNWLRLTTSYQYLYYSNLTADMLRADPPPIH